MSFFLDEKVSERTLLEPEELVSALNWRYAVKKFDPAGKIPDGKWDALEQALVLSASSAGLQPWKFLVVDDPDLRAKLRPVSFGQSQISDADKLVVFAVRSPFGEADMARYAARMGEVRGLPAEAVENYAKHLAGMFAKRPIEIWAARQVYIALGNFLTSAAVLGVDACPMEGIDPAGYDRLLGLKERGWATLFVATAGVRAADDKYADLPKVRYPREEVLEHV
jgi:nitroreductase